MKRLLIFSGLFLSFVTFGQSKSLPKTDFNTIFVCVDSISYNQLFQNPFVKDTLFFCKTSNNVTNTDSYEAKYFIGESATIEFFQPKKTQQLGDNFGDWGIEFKTRKINTLKNLIEKSKALHISIDTAMVTTNFDGKSIHWYKTLGLKQRKNELSILEYQKDYLQSLGFTKSQINKSMTYKSYNSILSNGKKYPRQFAMVNYIKLFADKKRIADLLNFAKLNGCKRIGNTITNGETTIGFEEVAHLPDFQIQEIGLSLLDDQKFRREKISENILIEIIGKNAKIVFKKRN